MLGQGSTTLCKPYRGCARDSVPLNTCLGSITIEFCSEIFASENFEQILTVIRLKRITAYSMKTICRLVLVVIFLTSPNAARSDDELFRIGTILPLTGPAAEYGVAIQNAFQLAKEDRPELFKTIRMFHEDSRLEGKHAVNAYHKLRNIDKVDLIYAWGVGPIEAVAPLAEAARFPIVTITADRAVSVGRKYVFRFHYHAEEYSHTLLRHLRSKGYRKFTILKSEVQYFDSILKGMEDLLRPDESLSTPYTFDPSDTDFSTIIAKLKLAEYDALGLFLVPGQISSFYRQASALRFQAPFFGTDFFDSEDEASKSGELIQGTFFPAFATGKNFRSRYRQRFGNDLQIGYAGNAYDFAVFFGQVLSPYKKKPQVNDLIGALKSAPVFEGVSGNYQYNETPKGSGFDVALALKVVTAEGIKELEE